MSSDTTDEPSEDGYEQSLPLLSPALLGNTSPVASSDIMSIPLGTSVTRIKHMYDPKEETEKVLYKEIDPHFAGDSEPTKLSPVEYRERHKLSGRNDERRTKNENTKPQREVRRLKNDAEEHRKQKEMMGMEIRSLQAICR